MIKITNNWDDFLQNYASANSGDSSGGSKQKDRLSVEKRTAGDAASARQANKPTHVRFNSLADISNKYNTQKKLKFKNGKIANNQYKEPRVVLGKVDTNSAQIGSNSAPFMHPNLVKSHSAFQKLPEDLACSPEKPDLGNFSYENLEVGNDLDNKENINLLESVSSIEEKMEDESALPDMAFTNRICKFDPLALYKPIL